MAPETVLDMVAEVAPRDAIEFISICNLTRFCQTDPLTGGMTNGWSTVR
jgi:hypothetical protein